MKFGLSSLLFVRIPIERAIDLTSEAGFEAIELIYDIPHFPLGFDRRALAGLRELISSRGLEVSVHSSLWDLNPASHLDQLFRLTLKFARNSVNACRALNGEVVVLHPGRCPIPEVKTVMGGAKERYRKFVSECLSYAGDRGVTLALENADGHPTNYPSSIEDLLPLLRELEGAGVAFDIGHAYLAERRHKNPKPELAIASAIKRVGNRLVHVHLHDNRGVHDDHLVPGKGAVNFEPIVAALKAIKYGRLVVAELWDPERPERTARLGLKHTKRLF